LDVLVNGPHITPVEVEELEKLPLIAADVNPTNCNYNATTTTSNGQNQQEHHAEAETVSNNSPTMRYKVNIMDNTFIHYASTFSIFAICYMFAVHVPGVTFVWSILGCSMGYFISFILPCVCYLKIQKRYPAHTLDSKAWVWFSWILLLTSIVATVVCTTETMIRLL